MDNRNQSSNHRLLPLSEQQHHQPKAGTAGSYGSFAAITAEGHPQSQKNPQRTDLKSEKTTSVLTSGLDGPPPINTSFTSGSTRATSLSSGSQMPVPVPPPPSLSWSYWFGFRLLRLPDHIVTVDHSGLWRNHLIYAIPDGQQLRDYFLQQYSVNVVCLSVLLCTQLCLLLLSLLYFSSSASFSNVSSSDSSTNASSQSNQAEYMSNVETMPNLKAVTDVWKTTIPENLGPYSFLLSLAFWSNFCLIVSAIQSLMGLVSSFAAWAILSAIHPVNIHTMARSSMGQYAIQLPHRFRIVAIYLMMVGVLLFVFQLFMAEAGWLCAGLTIIILVIMFILLIHTTSTYSALGRLVMHTSAMSAQPVVEPASYADRLPAEGLQRHLMRTVKDYVKRNRYCDSENRIKEQYSNLISDDLTATTTTPTRQHQQKSDHHKTNRVALEKETSRASHERETNVKNMNSKSRISHEKGREQPHNQKFDVESGLVVRHASMSINTKAGTTSKPHPEVTADAPDMMNMAIITSNSHSGQVIQQHRTTSMPTSTTVVTNKKDAPGQHVQSNSMLVAMSSTSITSPEMIIAAEPMSTSITEILSTTSATSSSSSNVTLQRRPPGLTTSSGVNYMTTMTTTTMTTSTSPHSPPILSIFGGPTHSPVAMISTTITASGRGTRSRNGHYSTSPEELSPLIHPVVHDGGQPTLILEQDGERGPSQDQKNSPQIPLLQQSSSDKSALQITSGTNHMNGHKNDTVQESPTGTATESPVMATTPTKGMIPDSMISSPVKPTLTLLGNHDLLLGVLPTIDDDSPQGNDSSPTQRKSQTEVEHTHNHEYNSNNNKDDYSSTIRNSQDTISHLNNASVVNDPPNVKRLKDPPEQFWNNENVMTEDKKHNGEIMNGKKIGISSIE